MEAFGATTNDTHTVRDTLPGISVQPLLRQPSRRCALGVTHQREHVPAAPSHCAYKRLANEAVRRRSQNGRFAQLQQAEAEQFSTCNIVQKSV
jgi:hypothetical protein